MSAQILLQGRLLGSEDFLLSPPADRDNRAFEARSMWLALVGEAIPRALLADLELPPLLLGSSGSDRFLVILPDQARADSATAFLTRVSETLSAATGGRMRLAWSATENLGDWTVVRKRLEDGMREHSRTRPSEPGFFEPYIPAGPGADRIPRNLRDAESVAWGFDVPSLICSAAALNTVATGNARPVPIAAEPVPATPIAGSESEVAATDESTLADQPAGDENVPAAAPIVEDAEPAATSEPTPAKRLTWDVGSDAALSVARHSARSGDTVALPKDLARRARGEKLWAVLRGEIDDFGTRMRRVQSVEEHVHLSTLYKHFLSGEIELLCSQGEYFQRVTVLSSGGAEFALYGAWDALAGFARELERVFSRFAQENLKDLPGAEAKTLTMALSIAEPGAPLARVYEDCGRDLDIARAADKDCFHMLGKVLEWKQLNDAAELKDAVVQINEEFRGGRVFLGQLRNLYKKVESAVNPAMPGGTASSADEERLMARALRFQRRFARVGNKREREFQKLRSHLMKEMAGRRIQGRLKLRPEGLIALEWARLAED